MPGWPRRTARSLTSGSDESPSTGHEQKTELTLIIAKAAQFQRGKPNKDRLTNGEKRSGIYAKHRNRRTHRRGENHHHGADTLLRRYLPQARSEERRVGEEGRAPWA